MKTTSTQEYAVHLSQRATNGTPKWRAFIETLPQVVAEGENCEIVLEEIGRKLRETLANNERASTPATTNKDDLSPQALAELEAQVQAQGHKFYGIFADDPGALDVFDEIEHARDQQTIN